LGLGAYFKEKQVLNQTKTRTIHCWTINVNKKHISNLII
jgi:hypothetical protein